MSIASELNALNGYILGAYGEINTKGGTVPANKNMANLASAIASISTGSSTTITPLSVTENGIYTAPTGTAYSPVTVNVSGGGGGDSTVETGTVTVPSTGAALTITHNLGEIPSYFVFRYQDDAYGMIMDYTAFCSRSGSQYLSGYTVAILAMPQVQIGNSYTDSKTYVTMTANSITLSADFMSQCRPMSSTYTKAFWMATTKSTIS